MKTLFLLRHAKSSWDDAVLDDFDRPLSKRGRRAAKAMGEYLATLPSPPGQVICSSARRTRETLGHIQEILGNTLPARFEKGIYLADPATLLRRLRRLDDSLTSAMVVGHNPGLERLAVMLTGSDGDSEQRRQLALKFPTGSLAVIQAPVERWHDLEPGCGRLDAFVRPRDLE